MPDDHTFSQFLALPLGRPHLPHHFPDGSSGHGKIVFRTGQPLRQRIISIFHVRQVDIHLALQHLQRFDPLIAAAVVYNGNGELFLQRRQNTGQKMGGRHKVDVLRPLVDQFLHHLPQLTAVHRRTHRSATDGFVLAVGAFQGAAAEENSAAAACACQSRLFPLMKHRLGHQDLVTAAAKPGLTAASVNATFSRT